MSKIGRYLDEIKGVTPIEYTWLNPTNKSEAEAAFLADLSQRVPEFEYNLAEQSSDFLKGQMAKLKQIQDRASDDCQLSNAEKALVATIAGDTFSSLNLLCEASLYRQNPNPVARFKFKRETEQRYGSSDKNVVLELLDCRLKKMAVKKFTNEEDQIYQRLLVNLPDNREDFTHTLFTPKPETIKRYGELYLREMWRIYRHIPQDKEMYTPEEVVDLYSEILDQEIRPWSQTKFHVALSEDKTFFDMSQSKLTFFVPRKRARGPYTKEVITDVVCGHENIHLLRGVVFENCGIPSLFYGLPGYNESEEGITTACEVALSGKGYEHRNDHRCIIIGLIEHFDYDFRKAYDVWRDLHYLSEIDPQASPEEKAARFRESESLAFAEVTRATRGTGILPYTRDLIYFMGSQKIWKYLEESFESGCISDEDIAKLFFWSGKINIFDRKHLAIAEAARAGKYGKPAAIPWS